MGPIFVPELRELTTNLHHVTSQKNKSTNYTAEQAYSLHLFLNYIIVTIEEIAVMTKRIFAAFHCNRYADVTVSKHINSETDLVTS